MRVAAAIVHASCTATLACRTGTFCQAPRSPVLPSKRACCFLALPPGNRLLFGCVSERRSLAFLSHRGAGGCFDAGDGLNGRVDLRARCPRAYAIDTDKTDFRDDALSYDVASGTLAVHICDMTDIVPAGSLLDDVARLRLQSVYTGSMPLHMLPPTLLRESALSPSVPNECLTALLQIDHLGRVRNSRLVRSVIPPVRILTFDEVSALLSDTSIESDVHHELRALSTIATRRARSRSSRDAASTWTAAAAASAVPRAAVPGTVPTSSTAARVPPNSPRATAVRWRHIAADGSWRPEIVPQTEAHTCVDEALAMFSYSARGAAKRHNLLRLPQTENHRIATAPLRRYADLIAQRQLSAALCGMDGMPASEVAAVERWI